MAELKRIIVSLPHNLLQEIDSIVSQERCSRSEFIREAMRLYLEEKRKREVREKMKKGYLAMAQINLEIAEEFLEIENKTEGNYENYLSEGGNLILERE